MSYPPAYPAQPQSLAPPYPTGNYGPPSHSPQPPASPYGSYTMPTSPQPPTQYPSSPSQAPYPVEHQSGSYNQPPAQHAPAYPPQETTTTSRAGYGAPAMNPGYQQPGYPPPPPGQYGQPGFAPPPPASYGQQPPNAYGQPMAQGYPPQQQQPGFAPQQSGPYGGNPQMQGQYGMAPQQPGAYGAPPAMPGQYGAPVPQAAGYGGHPGMPPAAPAGPPLLPTPGYGLMPTSQQAGYDAAHDAQTLYKAMKGLGTDEKTLIRVLCSKDAVQMNILRQTFDRNYKNLVKYIKSETSGYLEEGLVAICLGPLDHDCELLRKALAGPGTNEDILNDVLVGRSNLDLRAIKARYNTMYHGRSLDRDVADDLSMKTKRFFEMILAAKRPEENIPVQPPQVEKDVNELYKATEGKRGTDELIVCEIFANRSDVHIGAVAYTYQQRFKKDFSEVINKEFFNHPHMKKALIQMLRTGTDRAMRDATLLEETMKGLGTKDHLLVTRVMRMHWNRAHMANVLGAYRTKYRQDLGRRIKEETSGDYETMLLAAIGYHGVKL